MSDEKQLSIVRCAACGEFLPAGRANLRFHNSSCRSRFWRRVRDIKLHSQLIQTYLADMESVLEQGINVPEIEREWVDIARTLTSVHRHLSEQSWHDGLFSLHGVAKND